MKPLGTIAAALVERIGCDRGFRNDNPADRGSTGLASEEVLRRNVETRADLGRIPQVAAQAITVGKGMEN